ncbi:hypothetical protein MPY17_04050 [Rhodococcus opacus]|uniref:hypothetical protein n=1 Tax=Rhodococcus opacus TaxID=37919 RepID=UPI001FF6BC8D|nr:hypothetical protein [Rhodococcus opacus]UOT04944.1 hypothetical protein MPY17_04050 [Rhodococcus opacus]
MAACRVVLDACVWLPQTLNNLLLTLADAELFRPVWTPDLLELLGRLTPRFVDASDRGAVPAVSALPEQIDSLPPEVRQTYRQPRAVDPAELVRFLGHTDLVNAAWAFLMPVCVDGDLLSVWPNVDPDFRAVLAQKWVRATTIR